MTTFAPKVKSKHQYLASNEHPTAAQSPKSSAGEYRRTSGLLAVILGALAVTNALSAEVIDLPATTAQLEGCELLQPTPENPDPIRLGKFDRKPDRASWTFSSPSGIYRIFITVRSPFGLKSFSGRVGNFPLSGFFPQSATFAPFDGGLVELAEGEKRLEIGGGWGFYEITGIKLQSAQVPPPPAPGSAEPVDPQATPEARKLKALLAANYGKYTLSGQMDEADLKVIQTASGSAPAIFASDLMFHSPSMVERQGPRPKLTEAVLRKAAAGHVISMLWHWNAPTGLVDTPSQRWWTGFYAKGTTFDFAAALDPANPEHALLLRDIDAIADQLRKFDEAKVPILWRPLHECESAGFWWGTKGPEPYKQLWRLLFERLTKYHKLHNLIWVHTSEDAAWYPGDDVVDVVCADAYPDSSDDALVSRWESLRKRFDGRKMIALGEFPGVPNISLMRHLGVHWAWFTSWKGSFGPARRSTPERIRQVYQSEDVITLDELKTLPSSIRK